MGRFAAAFNAAVTERTPDTVTPPRPSYFTSPSQAPPLTGAATTVDLAPPPHGAALLFDSAPPPVCAASNVDVAPPPMGVASRNDSAPPPHGAATTVIMAPPPKGAASRINMAPPPHGAARTEDGVIGTVETAPPPTGAAAGEKTKRGRPLSWTPSLVTEEDAAMMASLQSAYGPDETSAISFAERYRAFCAINSYDPTERKSLMACVAQARRQGMAASSIDTYVDRYLSEHPIKGSWYVRSLTAAAHANSAPVNPRPTEWDEDALLNVVRSAASVGDELLLWILLISGARPADVERLTFQQVAIEEDCLRISWWLRKAQRTRRERHEETYSFRWAFPPSQRVKDFFKGRPGTHGILPLEKCYQRGRIAAHVSALLEPLGLTSYVFRDRLEALLVGEGASSGTMKDLLDHCDGTGRSSYRKTPLAKATADRVRAAKVSKKKK